MPQDRIRVDLVSPAGNAEATVGSLVGRQAVYRLVFASMDVIDLPATVTVGRVTITHTPGPVETQRTTIVQQPGWKPTFVKWMDHPHVGSGQPLTVCTLPVVLTEDPSGDFGLWRAEVLASLGFLVIILDERLAQRELAEDVSLLDDSGNVIGNLDVGRRVRTFEPTHPWFTEFGESLRKYGAVSDAGRLRAACRWYLRAVTEGPTAEAIVLLWVAMESLMPAPGGGQARNQVRDVEAAVQAADRNIDLAQITPSVGRLAGLRAQIVHQGLENDPLIDDGFYALESLIRLLLRSAFGVTDGWPFFPDQPMLRESLQQVQRAPEVRWVEPPTDQ